MSSDVVSVARAAADDGFEDLPPAIQSRILKELSRTVFGTASERGVADELRSLRTGFYVGGTFGLALQIIATLQLQEPIKHFVVSLLGGHS